jgi:hypothetical protein
VSGKVKVEFEHSQMNRAPIFLDQGQVSFNTLATGSVVILGLATLNSFSQQFVGDMALLGERDWADSTCFNFIPQVCILLLI